MSERRLINIYRLNAQRCKQSSLLQMSQNVVESTQIPEHYPAVHADPAFANTKKDH